MRLPTVSPRFATALLAFAIAALCVQVVDAIVAERTMYADASHFFVGWRAASERWSVADDAKHVRVLVNAVNQLPANLARRSGVTDLRTLRLAFGASLFVMPMLILAWCVRLGARASDYRLALAMGAGTVAAVMPSQIYMLEQSITGMAVAWLLLSYQLLPIRWRPIDAVIVLVAAAMMMYAHESVILWGSLLAGTAFVSVQRVGWRKAQPRALAIGAVGAIAALHVAWWIPTHPILDGTSNFLGLWYQAMPWSMWHGNARPSLFLLVVAPLAIVGAMPSIPDARGRRLRRAAGWVCAVGSVLVAVGGAWPWVEPHDVDPRLQFDLRFYIPFVSVAFMALGADWVLSGPDRRAGRHTTLRVAIAMALLAAVSWQFAGTRQWRQFDGAVRAVLSEAPDGEIDPMLVRDRLERAGTPNAWRMQWEWLWPILTLSRLDQPQVSAIFAPLSERQQFRSPRRPDDPLLLPWIGLPPRRPYVFDRLAAACAAGRCSPMAQAP